MKLKIICDEDVSRLAVERAGWLSFLLSGILLRKKRPAGYKSAPIIAREGPDIHVDSLLEIPL